MGLSRSAQPRAKTARRRLIPIADNLAEWLRPYAGREGKIYNDLPQAYHWACQQTAIASGLPRWPQNGLRHSYASYHLALHQGLAPAYVFFEPGRVRIQVFIRKVEPSGSCAGLKPTALGPSKAVTLTLPEPLGARRLRTRRQGLAEAAEGDSVAGRLETRRLDTHLETIPTRGSVPKPTRSQRRPRRVPRPRSARRARTAPRGRPRQGGDLQARSRRSGEPAGGR